MTNADILYVIIQLICTKCFSKSFLLSLPCLLAPYLPSIFICFLPPYLLPMSPISIQMLQLLRSPSSLSSSCWSVSRETWPQSKRMTWWYWIHIIWLVCWSVWSLCGIVDDLCIICVLWVLYLLHIREGRRPPHTTTTFCRSIFTCNTHATNTSAKRNKRLANTKW